MQDMCGNDPELTNHIAFYDMDRNEMQIDLWKRVNVLFKKHRKEFFEESMFKPPYVDPSGYF